MTPGAKFSTSTSARLTISISRSRPCGFFRSSETERLLALSIAKGSAAPPTTPRRRRCSPPFGSTLMTSAPACAIRKVA